MTQQTLRKTNVYGGAARTVDDANVETYTVSQGLSTIRQLSGTIKDQSEDFFFGVVNDKDFPFQEDGPDALFEVSHPHEFVPEDPDSGFELGQLDASGSPTIQHAEYDADRDAYYVVNHAIRGEDNRQYAFAVDVDTFELSWLSESDFVSASRYVDGNDDYLFFIDQEEFTRWDKETGEVVNVDVEQSTIDIQARDMFASNDFIYFAEFSGTELHMYGVESLELEDTITFPEDINSDLAFDDGSLYLVGDSKIYKFDEDSREIEWESDDADNPVDPVYPAGDGVYVGDFGIDGNIKLDASTGDEEWRVTDDLERIRGSPVLHDGAVIYPFGNNPSGAASLDASDGSVNWITETETFSRNIVDLPNDDGSVLTFSDGLHQFNKDTGELENDNGGFGRVHDVFLDDGVYWFLDGSKLIGTEFEKSISVSEAGVFQEFDRSSPFTEELSEFVYNGETAFVGVRSSSTITTMTLGINPVVGE